MKILYKNLITFIILGSVSLNASAQSNSEFAPIGAEWWHTVYNNGLVTNSWVEKDTIINDTSCRKVIGKEYRSDTLDLAPIYLFEGKDTIFFFNPYFEKFTPLYVFNATEGDTICLPVTDEESLIPNPIAGGDTSFCFVLDSIRNVDYDGNLLETFFVSPLCNDPYTSGGGSEKWPCYAWTGKNVSGMEPREVVTTYTREFGANQPGFLPHKLFFNEPVSTTELRWGAKIRCYKDDDIEIRVHKPCHLEPSSIDNYKAKSTVEVFPNPAKNSITLRQNGSFLSGTEVTLLDITGRVCLHTSIPTGKDQAVISLDTYNSGQYLLKVKTKESISYKKICIIK